MQDIAIFGGTFDPVHQGHLFIAQKAVEQFCLEQVIWVPSQNPPHKQAALFEHRVAMLQLATQENPKFTVSSIELQDSGTSYAINTFKNLSSCYPNTHWYWIIGLDAFQTLPNWYGGDELAQMCDWLIAPRHLGGENIAQSKVICKGIEQNFKENLHINWKLLSIPLVIISSSMIRRLSCAGYSIHDLVTEPVRAYINTHRLYSNNSE
ncbi:nicotinate (nicotinamide) nucleotide adenylyltransferase [Cronbergia sp. UHCC 0137]|uniref:nicotinate (nicotinamide) nucleotide adenylyltransferase n=1 Tax=Cronbergia sp. UHCC 0137 TaxID=3110239 RepID=UPI002B2131DF|nr:nicotinate (nicotinamide) nucleotide adenylyltransferase [Cronbergia sp. UHCC 0137]MEA5619926.1 nicotinate (nicotinamide) nucleotide adenylyltransferase [Cronbergia sp. UHCC 0137]